MWRKCFDWVALELSKKGKRKGREFMEEKRQYNNDIMADDNSVVEMNES